jgi:hypothetical protein
MLFSFGLSDFPTFGLNPIFADYCRALDENIPQLAERVYPDGNRN